MPRKNYKSFQLFENPRLEATVKSDVQVKLHLGLALNLGNNSKIDVTFCVERHELCVERYVCSFVVSLKKRFLKVEILIIVCSLVVMESQASQSLLSTLQCNLSELDLAASHRRTFSSQSQC